MERPALPPPPPELLMSFKTHYSLEAQKVVDHLTPVYEQMLDQYRDVCQQAKQDLSRFGEVEAERMRADFTRQAELIKQEIMDFMVHIEAKMKEVDGQ